MPMLTPATAEARHDDRRYKRSYPYKEWRGRDGRTYCRKSDGTTGLVIGAAGGALLGRAIDSEGDRATGTIVGAAAGALLGKSIDSGRRCR
ncbi:MAG: glycine zipper 2TM domain-containing protein [Sphingomonadales bacterium]|nr:MAG: glycine zipper 2TM domain-containing protein [Sphingomonadales bacterium]TNF05562.1 MAG: glycine zipper 2TM domain-containing protein [Sphingomonadales bacterium]